MNMKLEEKSGARGNKTKIYLFLILLLAFFLRVYKCRWGENIYSGDEAGFILMSVYFVKFFHFSNLFLWVKSFFKIISATWGYGYQFVIFVNILILRLFQVNLNEFTLAIPYILWGTVDCALVYLIVRELYSEEAGLVSALFLAVSPWHIMASRTAGNHAVPVFLLLCALYFFILSCKSKMQIRWQWVCASFFAGLYFVSDGQFPSFFLLMIFASYVLSADKSKFYELMFNRKIVFFPVLFMLPAIAAQIYFFIVKKPSYGYLGHYLAKKAKLGFYLPDILVFLKYNLGGVLLAVLILGFIYNYKKLLKLKPASILYLMLFLYLAPWIFMVSKESTVVINYLFPAELALTMLAGIFLADIFKLVKGYNFLKAAVLAAIVLAALFYAGGIYGFKVITNTIKFPAQTLPKNYGVKTAGFIIRQEYSGKNINIFTDLEPPTARYYFSNFNMLAAYDVNLNNPEELTGYFNKAKHKMDIAAISRPAYEILKKDLRGMGFHAAVIVRNKNEIVFFILKKEKQNEITASTDEYDPKFDKKYGNLKSLFVENIWETH